jgi:hypothetical protein
MTPDPAAPVQTPARGLRVTVEDLLDGSKEVTDVPNNDYLLLTVGNCYVDSIQTHARGATHVLVVKGRSAP